MNQAKTVGITAVVSIVYSQQMAKAQWVITGNKE
jgi:hypothetical protein